MPEETWIEVVEFEGLYAVSNHGNVKALPKCNPRNGVCWPERPMKLHDLKGYRVVWLRKAGGVHKKFFIHQLVGIHFIENPEGKAFVNHINKNRCDNRVSNLEWCTQSENEQHKHNYEPPDEPFDDSDIPF